MGKAIRLNDKFEFLLSNSGKPINEFLDIEMVHIPSGSFKMGFEKNDSRNESRERPGHVVVFSQPFELGRTAVTQAQWCTIMGNNPSIFKGDDLPVTNVSFDDVQKFLIALNCQSSGHPFSPYRLPSESEWEYACRAGGPHLSAINEIAWFHDNSGGHPHEVGKLAPNAWGGCDMIGNVWEWTSDSYCSDYYGKPRDGSPQQNSDTDLFMIRGGSWMNYSDVAYSGQRHDWSRSHSESYIGFRVAKSIFGIGDKENSQSQNLNSPEIISSHSHISENHITELPEITMCEISTGSFRPKKKSDSNVTLLQPFLLANTLITQGQWSALMGNNPSRLKCEVLPVTNISWNDAQNFIVVLNIRTSGKSYFPYYLPNGAELRHASQYKLCSSYDSIDELHRSAFFQENVLSSDEKMRLEESFNIKYSEWSGNIINQSCIEMETACVAQGRETLARSDKTKKSTNTKWKLLNAKWINLRWRGGNGVGQDTQVVLKDLFCNGSDQVDWHVSSTDKRSDVGFRIARFIPLVKAEIDDHQACVEEQVVLNHTQLKSMPRLNAPQPITRLIDLHKQSKSPKPFIDFLQVLLKFDEMLKLDPDDLDLLYACIERAQWGMDSVYKEVPTEKLDRCGNILFGPLFVSCMYPWPQSHGGYMLPILQLNLSNISQVMGMDFGSGVLQVWSCQKSLTKFDVRVIPEHDVSAKYLEHVIPQSILMFKADSSNLISMNWLPQSGGKSLTISNFKNKHFSFQFYDGDFLSVIDEADNGKLLKKITLVEKEYQPHSDCIGGSFLPIQYFAYEKPPVLMSLSEHYLPFIGSAQVFYERQLDGTFKYSFDWSC